MYGIVITGTHSGCGKTTVTLGLLAAFRKMGLEVQSFKAGPDFIDSGIHRLITGRPSRNLDAWMCGRDTVVECFRKHAADVDVPLVEGVMGMYDGNFSTADLALLLGLPVILVIDAYGMAESAGAVVKGFADGASGLIAGIVFNRVASETHYERLKKSTQTIPVFGYLPRDIQFEIPHRHLGLVVAEEEPMSRENIGRLADAVLGHIDVEEIARKVRGSGEKGSRSANPERPVSRPSALKIAVAYDKAFCFYYEDNLDLLRDAGAELVRFSPLDDPGIPDGVSAVYLGGGYPELYAETLSLNTPMLESISAWADSGRPLYAECGGLMYLSQGIHDFNSSFFRMSGVFPFETLMRKGRSHLGYREVLMKGDCIMGKEGETCRGHEFHYSEIADRAPGLSCIYSVKNGSGRAVRDEGYCAKRALASYIHIHFRSNPRIAENFIRFIGER